MPAGRTLFRGLVGARRGLGHLGPPGPWLTTNKWPRSGPPRENPLRAAAGPPAPTGWPWPRLAGAGLAATTAASRGDGNGRFWPRRVDRCARRRRHQVLGLVPQRGLEEMGRRPGHGRPAPVRFLVVTDAHRALRRRAGRLRGSLRGDLGRASTARNYPLPALISMHTWPAARRAREFEAQVRVWAPPVRLGEARPVPKDLVAALAAIGHPPDPPTTGLAPTISWELG